MIGADLGLSWSDWPFALLAALMLGVNLWVFLLFFPRRADQGPPKLSRAILVAFFLAASPLFWVGAFIALVTPSAATDELILLGMGVMMAAPGIWVIGAALPVGERPIRRDNRAWPALLAVAIVVNELLMGLVFVVATAAPGAALLVTGSDLIGAFAIATNSVWFFWAMLANMVIFLFWVPLGRDERAVLLALAASAAVGPFVAVAPLVGLVGMAAAMTVAFVILFESLARRATVSPRLMWTVLGVAGAFTGMAASQLYFVLVPRSVDAGFPFALFTVLMMAAELYLVARTCLAGPDPASPPLPWVQRPRQLTLLLAFAFASEWLMSAGFVFAAGPAGRLSNVTVSTLGTSTVMDVGQYLAGVVSLVGSVTVSPYFLGLMGIEMGVLVVLRMRSTPSLEQRTRLGLALGAYAGYSVVAPSLLPAWSSVPGAWPNIGAFGPVRSDLLPALLGSYAVFVALALLFGRRSYCSVLCTSAVMYGGTFSQRLIPTIRESPAARHHVLGGNWRRIPTLLGCTTWALLAVVAAVSAWNAWGGHGWTFGSLDIATLYSVAIWNVIWYAAFIAIPYVGMSPCRTWGWCSTGLLVGTVGRVGLYRKEALDVEVCRTCPTHDCGKACEVGLVEMPVVLARHGVYRSVKCVGASDCESACPYGNLVSRDVRDSVRRWVGLPDRFAARRRPDHPRVAASSTVATAFPPSGHLQRPRATRSTSVHVRKIPPNEAP